MFQAQKTKTPGFLDDDDEEEDLFVPK